VLESLQSFEGTDPLERRAGPRMDGEDSRPAEAAEQLDQIAEWFLAVDVAPRDAPS
jgi:hypothetical protein